MAVKKGKDPVSSFSEKFSRKWMLFGVLFLTIVIYSNSLSNQFIFNWDDGEYIVHNKYIKDLSFEGIKTIFTTFNLGNYHPLTTISNGIEYFLFGLNPKPFHFFNLLLHLGNTVLVFVLIELLCKKKEVAFFVSLFFAIHPMHVESVSWISERKDVLYSLFYLSALISYTHYVQGEQKIKQLFITLFLFTGALLSKSAAVSLTPLLFLFDYFLQRKWSPKNIWEKTPFFILSALFGIVAIYSQKSTGATELAPDLTIIERVVVAGYALVIYIFKFIFPINLSAIHLYAPKSDSGMFPLEYYLAPFMILFIAGVVYRYAKNKREVVFGLLFFLITIALVIQLIPVGRAVVAERYTYIPYVGLLFTIAMWVNHLRVVRYPTFLKLKPYLIAIMVMYVSVFSMGTYARNKVWESGMLLYEDAIDKNLPSEFLFNARGLIEYENGDYKAAIEDFSRAIRIEPIIHDIYFNRALAKYNVADFPGALEDFQEVLKIKPEHDKAYYNIGLVKTQMNDFYGAIAAYNRAISINPKHSSAYVNRGVTKEKLKDYLGAIEDHTQAIRLDSNLADAFNNRGVSWFYMNRKEEACEDWRKAAELGNTNARSNIQNNCR